MTQLENFYFQYEETIGTETSPNFDSSSLEMITEKDEKGEYKWLQFPQDSLKNSFLMQQGGLIQMTSFKDNQIILNGVFMKENIALNGKMIRHFPINEDSKETEEIIVTEKIRLKKHPMKEMRNYWVGKWTQTINEMTIICNAMATFNDTIVFETNANLLNSQIEEKNKSQDYFGGFIDKQDN